MSQSLSAEGKRADILSGVIQGEGGERGGVRTLRSGVQCSAAGQCHAPSQDPESSTLLLRVVSRRPRDSRKPLYLPLLALALAAEGLAAPLPL